MDWKAGETEREDEGVNVGDREITCPCCGASVASPSLEVLVDVLAISKDQEAVLSAIWRGKGMAVSTQRIFDAMYADDPDGGPSPERMYNALKLRLHKLRGKLEGTGIRIEAVGYRRGYRIVMKGRE